MRADEPSASGHIVRDGVRVAYEVFGTGGPVLVLLPCWIIMHARGWKAQVADLARDCRLVVVDGRGNGASDRPVGPDLYSYAAFVDDALAVMDHLGLGECSLLGFSRGGALAALLAGRRPGQVRAAVLVAPGGLVSAAGRKAREDAFLKPSVHDEGWARYNAGSMREDYAGFVRFFFSRVFCEPHSTKPIEDAVGWAQETSAEVLIDSVLGALRDESDIAAAYAAVSCPVLLIHGDADEVVPIATGRKVAELCGAEVMEMPGSGHAPHVRHPAVVNVAIRRFLTRCGVLPPRPSRRRRPRHAPRALYLSSPIGLGHARRDLAIAGALRRLRPGVVIDWLAQDPVTRLLETAGERRHPASDTLASESRHIEAEAGEHDLNVFQALRSMDEILVRNFRVFQAVLESDRYDLVIADEGWEVDHFWHEHPQLKRAPLVWMTDFVGFAGLPEGGDAEAALAADYNAEMVGHVEAHPAVRDRAIFVGDPADVVDDRLGPDLPGRRAWVQERFAFSGYVLGDGVPREEDKAALRLRLGFGFGEKVCVVTVGGSAVGEPLIRRILAALPLVRRRHPELRTIVVAGPRLQPAMFPRTAGVEFRGFEPRLPDLLAACDVALVQGGLSTCMELAATGTPFVYFPLKRHFEQNVHVAHRLDRYGAGRRLCFAEADPDTIAAALGEALATRVAWTPVERDGAARAAELIAELI